MNGGRNSPGPASNHVKIRCMKKASALTDWTPEQLALGKKRAETWKLAAVDLERIKRQEIREVDVPKPWSGLIELQRLFMKAAGRE